MNINIRSKIRLARSPQLPGLWLVETAAHDLDAPLHLSFVIGTWGTADTMRAALELAAAQRRDLDDELMAPVHASRAGRRA